MRFVQITVWCVLVAGTSLVVFSSVPYVLLGGEHPFLYERPHLTANTLWRGTLALHVASGIFSLPAGAFLLSRRALRRWPVLHRGLGRAYVYVLLSVMVPTGSILAFFAKGGWLAGSGFFLSGVFAASCAIAGVSSATERRVSDHRYWMLRAYGQLASAITFRVAHVVLQLTPMAYEDLYAASLWVSVLGNALAIEAWIAWSQAKPSRVLARHIEEKLPCTNLT